MNFEDLLSEIGDFGKYQRSMILFFMVPTTFFSALHVLSVIFMVDTPDHWCNVPQLSNFTTEMQKVLSLPINQQTGQFSRCKMYDLNYEYLDYKSNDTVKCLHGWKYDQSVYESTAVTKWDLVCDFDQLPSLILTLGNVGSVVGTLIFGAIADRYGRRISFLINLLVVFIGGMLSISTSSFSVFAICRTITGASLPASFQLPYIIVVEQIGSKQRSRLVCLSWVLWTFGGCALALTAYLTKSYVILGIVSTLPALLGIVYWKYLPSSPRFLISKGKYEEACICIQKIAKINGRPVPDDLLPKLMKIGKSLVKSETEQSQSSLFDLLRFPQLRKKLFIVTLNWCAIAAAYFGLIMNVSNLSGNKFLNYFYLSVVELPAFFVSCYMMDHLGRRWTNTIFVLLAGGACLTAVFVSSTSILLTIIASLIGKFGAAAAFMVIYQQAAELYPTPVRSLGMSIGATVSSLAIVFMPYVVYLGLYNSSIPYSILAIICMAAGLVSPLVPETLHKHLPQTIEDSEKFGADQAFFACARKHPLITEYEK